MGGKSTTSTQTVSIPPEVMARYNAVNARAEDVAQQPFKQYGGEFVAPLTPTQQAGVNATSAYSQSAQPYYGAATGLTLAGAQDVGKLTGRQIGQYMDPFVGSVVAPTLQALQQQQGQERSQLQTQAIKSGAYGGDRAGLERANLARQQELGTAQAIAPLLSQAYGQAVQTAQGQQGVQASDLARRMQAGQQIAGLGTGAQQAALQGAQAQIGAGTLQQQTQQAQDTAQYQQFLQERGYPFQVAQFLANIAMGTGALSGSTTTTTQPGGFFSDERLKDNIEPIGKTFDGQPIYRYDYGDGRTQIGLIAQDVLERGKPGVALDKSGYLTVDYRDATDDAAAMASMGGAVEEPGHYERGGYVGGGLVGAEDIKTILASQQQALAPFSQSGLYGGQGAGAGSPGGTGIVPAAKLPVPKLVTASAAPASRSSGMSQAVSMGKGISDLYQAGKGLKADFLPSDEQKAQKLKDAEALKPYLEKVQQSSTPPADSDPSKWGLYAYGGLVPRHHYDVGGPVDEDPTMPYGNDALGGNQDILGGVVKSGAQHIQSLPKPGEPPKQAPGLGNDLMSAASMIGAAKTLGSVASSAASAIPEWLAVAGLPFGLAHGGAAGHGFAYGGLIPRQAHKDGEAVIANYSDEADLPAVGAVETEAQAAPDYRAMAIEKAKKYGVNPEHMVKTIQGESSFVPHVPGDEGSSAGLGQFHVAGISQKYPNPGLGDEYFKARKPEMDLTPQEKVKYLSDPANQEDLLDYMAEHASKKGFGAWTAARNAGLVPGARPTNADLPAKGAKEAQYRAEEPGLIESLGDKLTSERYMVPALSFLGSMLASKSPFLGQAIGEGLVGGVAGYQSMQKQQMEMAKNLIDVVGNRFERYIEPGDKEKGIPSRVLYRNKLTGDTIEPSQMQATIFQMFKKAGLNPEQYGILPPSSLPQGGKAATEATAAGATRPAAEPVKAKAEIEAVQPTAGAAPAKEAGPVDMTKMNLGQLRQYYRKNPNEAGLEGDDAPNVVAARLDKLKEEETFATQNGFLDKAKQANELWKAERDRYFGLLDAAAQSQADINKTLNQETAKSASQYAEEAGRRISQVQGFQSQLTRLADLYSEFPPGRAAEFKANLIGWANGLGVGNFSKTLEDQLKDVSKYDEAVKIVMDNVYKSVADEKLVRAPAASARGISQTQPGPTLGAGAVYGLIGRMMGESEFVLKRDQAYLDAPRGTSPAYFQRDYQKANPYELKREIATGLSKIPLPKNISRAEVDSLIQTYGKHGYKPMGMEEVPAKTEGPAIPEPLQSKEGLVFSASRNQYRDAQGNIYDATGKRVQ